MAALYFDIETTPLFAHAAHDDTLSPATAKIATLTIYDLSSKRGVIYNNNESRTVEIRRGWKVKVLDESEILSEFWDGITHYDVLFGFGLRRFDIPFLTHRSITYDSKPVPLFRKEKNILRQTFPKVIDLQDEFSFHGNMQQPLSLQALIKLYHIDDSSILSWSALQKAMATKNESRIYQHCIAKSAQTTALYSLWLKHLASPEVLNTLL